MSSGYLGHPPFRVLCAACGSETCMHYPGDIGVEPSRYVSPGMYVLRSDGRRFKEALIYEDGRIEYIEF